MLSDDEIDAIEYFMDSSSYEMKLLTPRGVLGSTIILDEAFRSSFQSRFLCTNEITLIKALRDHLGYHQVYARCTDVPMLTQGALASVLIVCNSIGQSLNQGLEHISNAEDVLYNRQTPPTNSVDTIQIGHAYNVITNFGVHTIIICEADELYFRGVIISHGEFAIPHLDECLQQFSIIEGKKHYLVPIGQYQFH